MKLPISLLASLIFLSTCSSTVKDDKKQVDDTVRETTIYTCPMHAYIEQYSAGTCPICGMQLVRQNKYQNRNDLMLNERQIRLANITTRKASVQSFGQTTTSNGRLAIHEQFTNVVSSRVEGRIERLFIKETGRLIKRGEPLYQLYSEMLITLQEEYLLAKQQHEALGDKESRYALYLKAAEKKLLLFGLSESHIEQLNQTKLVQQRVTFFAQTSGLVTEINVSEGQYLSEGTMIYKLENIAHLWVEAEIYPHESSLVKIGDKVSVLVAGHESQPIQAQISFLSPEYKGNTQIIIMRAEVNNPHGDLIPGTSAQIRFNHATKNTITVPTNAVIRDKNGTHVYIQKGQHTFRPRMVTTGAEDFENVEISNGLLEDDTVVITGAYLLYSEIILKKGINALADLEHRH